MVKSNIQEMNIESAINFFNKLKQKLDEHSSSELEVFNTAFQKNQWFTLDEIHRMLNVISNRYLDPNSLKAWLSQYNLTPISKIKTIAIISAGNIPLVSFQDLLCVLVCGYKAQVKLSEKDTVLYHWIKDLIQDCDPSIASRIEFTERIHDYDAVIATGSDLAANHFKHYFQKKPNIIRGHRNSIAILNGDETEFDFIELGKDIFYYYGLGCRNVSKIYVPFNYDFSPLLKTLDSHFSYVRNHTKFQNNYDFQLAISLINPVHFLQGETILFIENEQLGSPLATIHFEYYIDEVDLKHKIDEHANKLQCIVSNKNLDFIPVNPFGTSQLPGLLDYPDNIDIMNFLISLQQEYVD